MKRDKSNLRSDCRSASLADVVRHMLNLDFLYLAVRPGADGIPVELVRGADGGLRAFEGRCPHQGALLGEGELAGGELVCRNHGWRFDVETGRRCGGPAAPLATPNQNAVATIVAGQATQMAVVTPPVTLPVTTPTQAASGAISGTLTFPSETTPALLVVAFNQTTGNFVGVETQTGQAAFKLENLEPGIYRLVAYLKDAPERAGGYTQFVLCGMSVECNDHSLIDIPVVAGQEAGGINLADWYVMEPGFFPANPFDLKTGASIAGQHHRHHLAIGRG